MRSLSNRRRALVSSDLCGAAILGLCAVTMVWVWGHGRLTGQNARLSSEGDCPSAEDDNGGRPSGSGLRRPCAGDPIVNSIGMRLVLIPAGEFTMGSPEHEEFRFTNESQHRVRISQPFYLGAYEVTVGQFRQFVEATGHRTENENAPSNENIVDGSRGGYVRRSERTWRNPGFPQADDHPAVYLSWNDAAAFCRWLRGKEGHDYRLPTEAEWEHACRAGMATRFSTGDAEADLFRVANVRGWLRNAHGGIEHLQGPHRFTTRAGVFEPNGFGLYDMHGNVWEWCADWYDGDYSRSAAKDPTGPSTGEARLARGGSFAFPQWSARSANRMPYRPVSSGADLGFRVTMIGR